MKKIKNILVIGTFLLSMFTFVGCQEGMTLESADAIYIEIKPMNAYIMVGDTLTLSAVVTNVDGSIIDTPITWDVAQSGIVKLIDGKLIALQGGQGKTATVRATLTNGKYAITNVTVTNHVADGVVPVVDVKYTYGSDRDTVKFMVSPKGLLHDFKPVIINSDEKNVTPHAKSVIVDVENGLVSYAFSSSKVKASAKITLKIGPEGQEKEASADVIVCPQVISTLEDITAPITYELSKTMDINSEDTVWVNTMVNPSYPEDFNVAKQYYDWSATGNAAQLVNYDVKNNGYVGHFAYAIVRSAQFEGITKVVFNCYGTQLTTTINVENYNKRYPVNELTVDKKSLTIPYQASVAITPTVSPATSYPFHQPKFVSSDPTVAKVMGYSGSEMFIKGLKPGKATLTITSNDKTITVPVVVEDKVDKIVFMPGNDQAMFAGSTITWKAEATTIGGDKVQMTWFSKNPDIATVEAGEIGIGKITGVAVGTSTIFTKAGDKQSANATIKVIHAPHDVNYTNTNTDLEGNAVYETNVRGEKVISVDISPIGGDYGLIHVYIRDHVAGSPTVGTFTAPANKMWFEADGAFATVTSGTVTLSDYNGETKDVDVNLIVSVGNKQFTVKAKIKSY